MLASWLSNLDAVTSDRQATPNCALGGELELREGPPTPATGGV
jgi:hypothetical protein